MMQAYTDEMYCVSDYLKGRKPVITAGFPLYARNVNQIISRYTFNRLKDVTEVPGEVQMCCCELAESEHHMEKQQKESEEKISEEIDTYLASFSSAQESVRATTKEWCNTATKRLADSGLCYQGA